MELSNYEMSLKQYRDYHNTVNFALEQGIERGLKQGIKQGELKAKLAITKKLHANDIPIEQIIAIVDLPKEKIEELLKKD